MATNTSILIKRSSVSPQPSFGSLKEGELGFSYVSNTLFIGTGDGNYLTVGGGDVVMDTVNASPYVVHANTGSTFDTQNISTGLEVAGSMVVQGNFTVNGTTTYINSTTVETGENILALANNNSTGDTVDIGYIGKHEDPNNAGSNVAAGLVRDASDFNKRFVLFDGPSYDTVLTSGIDVDTIKNNGQLATLSANIDAPYITTANIQFSSFATVIGNGASADITGEGVVIGKNAFADGGPMAKGVAVGADTYAGSRGTSIGYSANSASYGVAIGNQAKATVDGMFGGAVVINAGSNQLTATEEGFYVNPIRYVSKESANSSDMFAVYDSMSKELRYTDTIDGGSF